MFINRGRNWLGGINSFDQLNNMPVVVHLDAETVKRDLKTRSSRGRLAEEINVGPLLLFEERGSRESQCVVELMKNRSIQRL